MTSSHPGFPCIADILATGTEHAEPQNEIDKKTAKSTKALSTKPAQPLQWTLGYCTNIHAGADVAGVATNLETIAADVRKRILEAQFTGQVKGQTGKNFATIATTAPPLGVGLWLSAEATVDLRRNGLSPLTKAMKKARVMAYTINGFPHDNFHQDIVKHAVYSPTWWDDARIGYTRDLAKILSEILPESTNIGSISTLPIGWPQQIEEDGQRVDVSEDQLHHAGTNLRRMAEDLRRLEERTGKRIVLAIEPEPGCILDTAEKVIAWFDAQLPDATHRRYIGVCHDVCHSAVMGESQRSVLDSYAKAGIVVGKVQISSAIVVDWKRIAPTDRAATLIQLRSFAEDRYLHQTGRIKGNGSFELHEDLPALLDDIESKPDEFANDQCWTIHFHVPIFVEQFGHLQTTRDEVLQTLAAIEELTDASQTKKPLQFTGHLEVETYAWSVLPKSAGRNDLAGDIASELIWLNEQLQAMKG